FRDADDFHPPENVAKMSSGIPLTDVDRAPWLASIRAYIAAALSEGENAVVTCSALKETYREAAIPDGSQVNLVHLDGDYHLILDRRTELAGQLMKPEMLKWQLPTLERPAGALQIDVANSPEKIVAGIRHAFGI